MAAGRDEFKRRMEALGEEFDPDWQDVGERQGAEALATARHEAGTGGLFTRGSRRG